MKLVLKVLACVIAIAISYPAFGAITLCPRGELSAAAYHGADRASFYLALDPALNAAVVSSAKVEGDEVLLESVLGPQAGTPLTNPACFFLFIEIPGSLDPGAYMVRWTVKRIVTCPSGTCEAERATFTRPLSVEEPLVCSPPVLSQFRALPRPVLSGVPFKVLHASQSSVPWRLSDPVITVNGKQIEIRQNGTYPYEPLAPTVYCVSTEATLGALAAGDYELTWILSTNVRTESYKYPLTVLNAAAVPALQPAWLAAVAVILLIVALCMLRPS